MGRPPTPVLARPMRAVLLLVILLAASVPAPAGAATGLTRVVIVGDDALAQVAAQEGWSGDGTPDAPYVVTGLILRADAGPAISVEGTRAHLILRNMEVLGGLRAADGVRLVNVRNITVEGITLENHNAGIRLTNAREVTLRGNVIKSSAIGIALEESSGNRVEANVVSINDHDIDLRNSAGNTFGHNNLSISAGGTGFFFRDPASYRNDIPPSNRVNYRPMQWATNVIATRESPLLLRDSVVDLAGITNIAQLAVIDSRNVTVDAPVIRNGAAAGILILDSRDIHVHHGEFDRNAKATIHLEDVERVRVENNTLQTGGWGVQVIRGRDVRVDGNDVAGHAQYGVEADKDSSVMIFGNRFDGNRKAGVGLHGPGHAMIDANTFEAHRAAALVMDDWDGNLSVRRNTFANNTIAVRLEKSTNTTFDENRVHLAGSGQVAWHFADTASYVNHLPGTNTVNDESLQWFHGLTGTPRQPVRIEDPGVRVTGMTNVAQLMIHGSVHVEVIRPQIWSGIRDGIVVHESDHVTVVGGALGSHKGAGIALLESSNVTVANLTSRLNTVAGLLVQDSPNTRVANVTFSGNTADGARVTRSRNMTIVDSRIIENTQHGLVVDRTSMNASVRFVQFASNGGGGIRASGPGIAVSDTTFRANAGGGLQLAGADRARVANNRFAEQPRHVMLEGSSRGWFTSNDIALAPGEVGFHLSGIASYLNHVDETNLVAGEPVRWYVEVNGSRNQPVRVDAPTVGAAGVTNVAQMIVYRSRNITITNATALDGLKDGILVLESQNVTVADIRLERNVADGLVIRKSRDVAVARGTIKGNFGNGAHVDESERTSLGQSLLGSNGRDGVAITRSTDTTLDTNLIHGNTATGVSAPLASILRLSNNTVLANGRHGIHLDRTVAPHLVNNSIGRHDANVLLQTTSGGFMDANAITVDGAEVAWSFKDAPSYANRITANNTVNGHPVHWYWNITGTAETPLVLANLTSVQRGVTNVAQIMIGVSNHVRLVNATVANGLGDGILLYRSSNTTVHLSSAETNANHGILATGGGRLAFTGNTLRTNGRSGLDVSSVPGLAIERNDFQANGVRGLSLESAAAGTLVLANRFIDEAIAIRLKASSRVLFENNTVERHREGIGFHFDDAASYDNAIDGSNRVDGVPMHWYTHIAGNETASIHLPGIVASAPRMTNVGQVMVYKSSYVTIDAPVTAGGARGIFAHKSANLRIEGARTTDAVRGIELDSTLSSTVENLVAVGADEGVRLTASALNTVRNVQAPNASVAVQVGQGSNDNVIWGINATAVRSASVRDPTATGASPRNLIVDAGLDKDTLETVPVSFLDTVLTTRYSGERIVRQFWEFGDGNTSEVRSATPHRPVHTYTAKGTYVAALHATTLDGREFHDWVTVRVHRPLSEPRNVTADPGDGFILVSWRAPEDDAGNPVLGYRVFTGATADRLDARGGLINAEARILTNLTNGVPLHVAVAAVTSAGMGPRSEPVNATPAVGPGSPTHLAGAALDGVARLSWRGPEEDGGSPVDRYRLYRSDDRRPDFVRIAEVENATTYLDNTSEPGRRYRYMVTAVNAMGESAPSGEVVVALVALPGAPAWGSGNVRDGRIHLEWLGLADRGGSDAVTYVLYRVDEDGRSDEVARGIIGTNHSMAVDGPGLKRFRLAAENEAGVGPESATLTVTVSAADDRTPPRVEIESPGEGDVLAGDGGFVFMARVTDDFGVGKNGIRVLLDGRDVTAGVQINGGRVTWRTNDSMPAGDHRILVEATDVGGNVANATRSFTIESDPRLVWGPVLLDPAAAQVGESVGIQVRVTNEGRAPRELEVPLRIDGVTNDTRAVHLEPGAGATLAFTVVFDTAGTYLVEVGGAEPGTLDIWDPAESAKAAAGGAEDAKGIPGPGAIVVLGFLAALAIAWRARKR